MKSPLTIEKGSDLPEIARIRDIIASPERDFIYDLLPSLRLQLAVDIGAAAGDCTRRIRLAGGANLQVVAFEPFPGNFPFFHETTRDLDNVRLVRKAVSDRRGTAEFTVPSVVQGTEPGWESLTGYSSVGFLAPGKNPFRIQGLKAILKSALKTDAKRGSSTLVVETTSIDSDFSGRRIDFMKVDVQGAEPQVLAGARDHLQKGDIGLLYVEWTGSPQVTALLAEAQYRIYDSSYIVAPTVYDQQAFEAIGFGRIQEVNLSTGTIAYDMFLEDPNVTPVEAMEEVTARGLGWIQTDLIAVSPQLLPDFHHAVSHYNDARRGLYRIA